MSFRIASRDERGVALIMALVLILILSAIVLALVNIATSSVDVDRLTQSDTLLQYLAQAAGEDQIYQLKRNINAGAVSYTNYPVLAGEIPGSGRYWYRTTLTCTADCFSSTARTWTIDAFGELRQLNGFWTILQQRAVRIKVQITYTGSAVTGVSLTEWAEVYP
jgi:Tfp pilus assembly protein PilV